jgi:VWFA-related protein
MGRYYRFGPAQVITPSSVKLLLLFLALPLTGNAARAQAAAQPSHAPSLTVTTRLVVLDVVAADANGKPVPGLTEKDFQVYEDGKPQRIRSVEPPTAHTLPPATVAAGADATFDPASPASFGRSPVNLLILDQANTHFADSSFARRQLHDFLARQPALLPQPTTLLTVYDQHFKQLQPFTRSRDLLLKALAAAPTRYAWELEINGNTEQGPLERLDQCLRSLELIAQSTATIPGRKNLIWVGGGFPTIAPTTLDDKDAQEVKDTLRHVTDVLLDTRVTLYAVDPGSNAAGLTEITDPTQASAIDAAGDGTGGGSDPFDATEDFDKLGPVTGGRVVRGRNDVSQQIAASIELADSFYTLAYSPAGDSAAPGKYRHILVRCLRPGVTVTTREGYYPAETQSPATATTNLSYDLSAAAESPLPLNAVHVAAARKAAAGSFVLHVAARDLTWTANADGTSTAHVAVLAVALSAKGAMLSHTLRAMTATAVAGTNLQDAARQADFACAFAAPGKTETIRFIVRDATTGRMGSSELPAR